MLKHLESLAEYIDSVRAWSLSHSKTGNYTSSIKMYRTKQNTYVLVGDYHPDLKDPKTEVLGRFREIPPKRNNFIIKQSKVDDNDCKVLLPTTPCRYDKITYKCLTDRLEGVATIEYSPFLNVSKFRKAEHFYKAIDDGFVSIIESSFGNKATLEAFYKELESFDGERSTATKTDDFISSCVSAYNHLAKVKLDAYT